MNSASQLAASGTDSAVADNLAALRAELGDVRLLAVSKGQSAGQVAQALAAGQRDFGENFMQEACGKMDALRDENSIRWHFIGHLQRNKARQVAGRFHWLHSLDRLSLLAPLCAGRQGLEEPLNVCLQVNISGLAGRPGAQPEELEQLAAAIATAPQLRLRGLMCMASPDADSAQREFRQMRDFYASLAATHPQMDTLSMGISSDWRLALAAGATLVRLGTAIFGPRAPRQRAGQ